MTDEARKNDAPEVQKQGRKKLTDEERKERKRAYRRAYYEANREKERASTKAWREANPEKERARKKAWQEANPEKVRAYTRLCNDKRQHAHIEDYVPTSDYKKDFNVRSVTQRGFLYLAFDRNSGALKIGCTQCAPETRLSRYHKNGGVVVFIRVSPILADVYAAEAAAHALLKGNVRHVQTRNKFKTSTNPRAEWFQLSGSFTFFDVLDIFIKVTKN